MFTTCVSSSFLCICDGFLALIFNWSSFLVYFIYEPLLFLLPFFDLTQAKLCVSLTDIFFRTIERDFGYDARATLKKWSRTVINIIKVKSKITFLRVCRDNCLIPPHLSKHKEFKTTFFSQQLLQLYKRLLFRSAVGILKLEIADAYKHLRFLRAAEASLVRRVYGCLPSYITRKFFTEQQAFFQRFERQLKIDRERKLNWISHSSRSAGSSLSPLRYFCVIPPRLAPPSHPYALRSLSSKS